MSPRRNRRGGNAIEVALTMPVFLAAIFGLMDYAWYFYNEAMTIEATRQGCRIGSVVPGSNTPTPEQTAYNYINGELQALGITQGSTSGNTASSFSTTGGEKINVYIDPPLTGTSVVPHMIQCDSYITFRPLVGFVPTPDFVLSSATFQLEQPDA